MYNPVQIARKFIALAALSGKQLTHMQLQKLTYIAHGYSLAILNRPLLSEPVSAWKFGPVIPGMYDTFKQFGNKGIPFDLGASCIPELDSQSESIIDGVYATYGDKDGIALSSLTHQPGTPWSKAYNGYMSTVISDDLIKSYYTNLVFEQNGCKGL
uniref:SocA family protein n=1 Tax=Providencia stuartii TaxID=588 RepID=A0AAI9DFK2_PROST|nr:SocA family protein [Providencia stuartii]ELR5083250.1 SocA family protein [Providencia stuartii]ELR5114953.1 SocA family protein [Providencia stuartii]